MRPHCEQDSGRARPSYVRVLPRSREEWWIWFESLWLLLHHWYIGAYKLLSTDLASQLVSLDLAGGSLRFIIRYPSVTPSVCPKSGQIQQTTALWSFEVRYRTTYGSWTALPLGMYLK